MLKRKTTPAPAAAAQPSIYGMAAEFDNPDDLLVAAERAKDAGYTQMDAYTPMPIHGLDEAIGVKPTRLPWLIFGGGLTGAGGMFFFQWWTNVVDYPMNIAGRPFFSWPAFIPITFEGMVLLAAFAAVFGLIAFNGLPMLYHPVFNTPRFERASTDLFFLCIEAKDPKYEPKQTRQFLESLGASAVSEVES